VSFANPEVFWFLLLLAPMGLYLYWAHRRAKAELLRIGGAWRGHRLHAVHLLKNFLSAILILATFFLLVAAWSGPSWGRSPVEEPQEGLDIALAVDVSRSMLAADAPPSRLAQAKDVMQVLLSAFPTARFSIVAFTGVAETEAPLTADRTELTHWVDLLGPDVMTAQGSDIEAGVDQALLTVSYSAARHRAIVVLSDGESRDGNAVLAARRAAAAGVAVYTVGVGTLEGGKIPDKDGFLKDNFGFEVQTRRVDSDLRSVAAESGGQFFLASDRAAVRQLQDLLSNLGNPASRGGVALVSVPRYRVFLFLALLTLTGFLVVRVVPWKGVF
jgi:Ca-activated chloride channel family protein